MTAPGRFILCDRGEGVYERYATWWQNDETAGRVMGHYFEDLTEAERNFEARCRRG